MAAMTSLDARALQAGVARVWHDAEGREQRVADDALTAILDALGHSAENEAGLQDSLGELSAAERCILPDRRQWGVAVQVPSLRGVEDAAFGTYADLHRLIAPLAEAGADAVAISPVHALFPGDGARYSPYSPSSRLFLNTTLAEHVSASSGPLIDWTNAIPNALTQSREAYATLDAGGRAEAAAWADAQGPALRRHAIFDCLYNHFGTGGWQHWPAEFQDPASDAVAEFATSHESDIAAYAFAQKNALEALTAVQRSAQTTGMGIGLIGDLAIGVDPGGSDAWAMQDIMLHGLTIGAPPDPLGPDGQNWNLTGFSPAGLRKADFAPFRAMLRKMFAYTGGVRIDHAFGLARLWVIPAGGRSCDGAYLSYPRNTLLKIVVAEAKRANALVIAEDLGTHPPGFADAIAARNMMGMRVLHFEPDRAAYVPASVAMTGTHDTPTIAGWWRGRDIDWNERLGRAGPDARDQRKEERKRLWSRIGPAGTQEPASGDTEKVVNAAIAYVTNMDSRLAIVPMEDVLGLEEQPNLPGTIAEHPNWQRRLPAPFTDLRQAPEIARRLTLINGPRTA